MLRSNRNRKEEMQDMDAGMGEQAIDNLEIIDNIQTVNAQFNNSGQISKYSTWYTAQSHNSGYFPAGRGLMNRFSSSSSTFTIPPMTNISLALTSANSTHLSSRMNFADAIGHNNLNDNLNFINFTKLIKNMRILGLMAIISYMTVILFTWIFANFEGYVYFSAGEPILSIKYSEWVLGFLGIFIAIDYLRKEIDGELS